MQVEEFIRAISEPDFQSLIGDNSEEFLAFIEKCEEQGRDRIIIRFVFETSNAPYYVWAMFPIMLEGEDDAVEIYLPDFSDLSTYLRIPMEVMGEPFFEIAL